MHCPMCQQNTLERRPRTGVSSFVRSIFGYYPWACTKCMHRLKLQDRGKVSRKRRSNKRAAA
jgi:hypothetical protein